MSERQRMVFSLTSEYICAIKDLANLRIAIHDIKDTCLYYGWINFLKNTHKPIVTWFSPGTPNEKKFMKLMTDTLYIALIKMKSEGRFNPFETFLLMLEECKNSMNTFIHKVIGTNPEIPCIDWEDNLSDSVRTNYSYFDWIDRCNTLKDTWKIVIDDTISILEYGSINKNKYPNTISRRKTRLIRELRRNGIQLKSGSTICRNFINSGLGPNISDIVKVMLERKFLNKKTDYRSRTLTKKVKR